MKIEVTQKHIDKAVKARRSDRWVSLERHCPVALAMKEAGFPNVQVLEEEILPFGYPRSKVQIPDNVREFVIGFDYHERAAPFTFDIPVSPEPAHAN